MNDLDKIEARVRSLEGDLKVQREKVYWGSKPTLSLSAQVAGYGGECSTCGFRYWEYKGHLIPCPLCALADLKGDLETSETREDILRKDLRAHGQALKNQDALKVELDKANTRIERLLVGTGETEWILRFKLRQVEEERDRQKGEISGGIYADTERARVFRLLMEERIVTGRLNVRIKELEAELKVRGQGQ